MRRILASEREVADALACFDLDAKQLRLALAKASDLAARWTSVSPADVRALIRSVVTKVEVHDDRVAVALARRGLAVALLGEQVTVLADQAFEPIALSIEARLRRAGRGLRLVVGGGRAREPDQPMITLLRDAHATRMTLLAGRDPTIEAMARRLGVQREVLTAHLRLTYLAPDIVRALIEGRYPEGLTPTRLIALSKDLPHDWRLQPAALGFETP